MVAKNLGNPRDGAGQGKAPWWALPDRWNPRVWVRDWLNKQTAAEKAAVACVREAMRKQAQKLPSEEAVLRQQLGGLLTQMQARGEAAHTLASKSFAFTGAPPAPGDSDGPTDESQLAAQLRERLLRMQTYSDASRPWPLVDPGANATPDPIAPEPGPQDSQTPGAQG